ncbi:alternate-type signal peptide domain-containing protein [Agromyces intestinalis]|uniref:Alternate-type signal peptide domain-containing protein n=1 Tax=Agromyces intestinalis TaxID=2592652 RepID=A0A5C1YDA4_9MICO|nr:alternate-type signal peptide domain-containing protein [Agromyces intestinalis]QEO14083.1 alternate-type signal peptide domain-containing protein [Agromyces intestinalis]
MKKTTKATIAIGAGVVLLLGGAGTLAYWTDEADFGVDQTITAGTLTVEPVDDGTWTATFDGGESKIEVPPGSDTRIVPGNTLEFTQTVEIIASGDDLYFTIEQNDPLITVDPALETALERAEIEVSELEPGGSIEETGTEGVYQVTANDETPAIIEVTLTIVWPFGADGSPATDNPAMGGVVTLSAGAITVTQVVAPTTP